jgi:hypothetical protein
MSAIEVIAEIEKLPRQEQEEVWSFLLHARQAKTSANVGVAFVSDTTFEQAAQKVFREHDELFQRLAQ